MALFITGCATKQLDRPKSLEESTSELPLELQKLKVETAFKELQPQPAPTPVAKKKPKKNKKSKGGVEPTATPTATPEPVAGFVIKNRRPPDGREQYPLGEVQTWNVGYLGFSAGKASVTIQPFKYINNRKVYHLDAVAKSSAIMNLFYSLDDKIESFMDFEGLFTHRFHLVLDETKQKRDAVEIHDIEKMNVFYWSRLNHSEKGFVEKKETMVIKPYSQDTLTALYYLRTVALTDGNIIKLPMVVEGKTFDVDVLVIRHEDCGTPLGKRRCAVLKPETRLDGILQQTADNFIWISDDAEKMIVRIEAHVKIGSVVVNLEKYEPGQH
ncbi:MAG: DUF3108 domain-containing protein [Xanthomonadaceae bacterium]|nr:DUF3108 domain-containing protein [Xanthomonadaceae bacterium]